MTLKKNKTIPFICAVAMSTIFSTAAAAQTSPAHNLVWEDKLYRGIEFLSDTLCQGRATGTGGCTEAAAWIVRSFRKADLMPIDGTYAKSFQTPRGKAGHNIIGMIPGSKKHPRDSYIIVGTHYDHLGTIKGKIYPGADDNASGVVAMTSLADMFAAMKMIGRTYGKNIIFAAFDGCRANLAGSEAFWHLIENGHLHDPLTGAPITRDKIDLMINLEQIGCSLAPLKSGREDYLIMLGNHSLEPQKRQWITECNIPYGLEIAHDYYGSKTFTDIFYRLSDQRIFIDNHVPAALFTSGITGNTYKTYDTANTINLPVLRRRIILIFDWLEKMTLE